MEPPNRIHSQPQVDPNENPDQPYSMSRRTIFIIVKIVCAIGFTCFALVNDVSAPLPMQPFNCIYDFLFEATAPINTFLFNNIGWRYFFTISSAVLIYFVIIYALVMWFIKSKSWRLPAALVVLSLEKTILQFVSRMKTPDNYPPSTDLQGVLRIFNHFMSENEFFFSIWIAIPILCACEFNKMGMKVMMGVAIFSSFYETFVMIITRGHYFCDIFAAFILAHYTFLCIDGVIKHIDNSDISLDPDYKSKAEVREGDVENIELVDEMSDKKSHNS